MRITLMVLTLLVISLPALAAETSAPDPFAELTQSTTLQAEALDPKKLAAAKDYLKLIPANMQIEAVIKELALKAEPAKRDLFLKIAKETISAETLNAEAEQSLVKTFTIDELQAMSTFFGTPTGKAIMIKMGTYQESLMPTVTEMVTKLQTRLIEEGIVISN